jgi:hypothetical protein
MVLAAGRQLQLAFFIPLTFLLTFFHSPYLRYPDTRPLTLTVGKRQCRPLQPLVLIWSAAVTA